MEVEGRRARGQEGSEEGRREGKEESRGEGKEEGRKESARREEASLKSIDVIATKLVISAEQERRSSQEMQEEGSRRDEEEMLNGEKEKEKEKGGKINQNVFACSAEILKALQGSVVEAPLLSPCTGGRKDV